MQKLQLSPQQINYLDTFGFLHFPGLMSDSISHYSNLFDELYQRFADEVIHWVHEAHYNKTRQVLIQIAERDPNFCQIVDDPRIDGIFESLLGADYNYRTSEGNIFSDDTYWHTDLYNIDFRYKHLKMLFYLDPVDADSGCLRVIPGSHHWGDTFAKMLEKNVYKPEENYGLPAKDIPGLPIPTQPGDLVIFDYRLKHATCNSVGQRRMFTVCASERFANEDMNSLAKLTKEIQTYTGKIYQDPMVESATPGRQKHLEQCLACEPLFEQLEA